MRFWDTPRNAAILPETVARGRGRCGFLADETNTASATRSDILLTPKEKLGVCLTPAIGEVTRGRLKGGPPGGIEIWVEYRYGRATVLLRLDFISQAAAFKIDAAPRKFTCARGTEGWLDNNGVAGGGGPQLELGDQICPRFEWKRRSKSAAGSCV
jgi:hypothetical protein